MKLATFALIGMTLALSQGSAAAAQAIPILKIQFGNQLNCPTADGSGASTGSPFCDQVLHLGPFINGPGTDNDPANVQFMPPAGTLPNDGLVVASIVQECDGQPYCVAGAWAAVEVQRCRSGIGTTGGCFGPNGEIMKVLNRVIPQRLRLNNLLGNVQNDVIRGPNSHNELVGKKGWLCRRLGCR